MTIEEVFSTLRKNKIPFDKHLYVLTVEDLVCVLEDKRLLQDLTPENLLELIEYVKHSAQFDWYDEFLFLAQMFIEDRGKNNDRTE